VVIHAAVPEAKKRNWKMNLEVVDSGGNLVAFQRMDAAILASIQIAKHKARAAATFRRETKFFEDAIQLMHLNDLLRRRDGNQPTAGKQQMIQISRKRWGQSTGFRDKQIHRRMP
jgi:uncharacterized protein GlcG (DUF336 family)